MSKVRVNAACPKRILFNLHHAFGFLGTGMTEMWAGNTGNGLAFTFKMLMIGISLAIGVFIGLV